MRPFTGLLLLACTFCGAVASAQRNCSHTVTIILSEKHDAPPDHATVLMNGAALEAATDGHYPARNCCLGQSYTFAVYAPGFLPDSVQLTVDRDTILRFELRHTSNLLEGVTVAHTRHANLPLQVVTVVSRPALWLSSGRGLTAALQSVPGVSSFNAGPTVAKPIIHGLHSNRILTLNNGIRQEDQQWGGEHAPNIDPYAAGNVTVIKGAAAVRYGADALGGVILVEPLQLRTTAGTSGELDIAAFSNNRMGVLSGAVEHAFKKLPALAFRVQGTLRKGGNYRIPGYYAANTGLEERDGSIAVQYHRAHAGAEVWWSHFSTTLGIYRGSHTGSRGDLLAAIASDTPRVQAPFSYSIGRPRQHVTHDLIKLRGHADIRLGSLSLTYGFQRNFRQEYDVLRQENGKAQINLSLYTHSLQLALEHRRFLGLTGSVGLDANYQHNTFADGDRLFIPVFYSHTGGVYAIERWRRGSWLVEAGLRYDLRQYRMINAEGKDQTMVTYNFRYSSPSATLGSSWKPTDRSEYRAVLATGWRTPQAQELFSAGFHGAAARVEIGNRDLGPERSLGINLEASWKSPHDRLNLEAGVYTQQINNFIFAAPGKDILTIRGFYRTYAYQQTDARLTGADLQLAFLPVRSLTLTLKGSTVLARDLRAGDWLYGMTADRASVSVKYSFGDKAWSKGAWGEITLQCAGRQTRIPANFDSLDYRRPPAGYAVLNLAIGTTLQIGRRAYEISLTGANLTNARYRDYLDAFRYFIDAPGRDVALRIRIPFSTINQGK